MSAVQPIRVFLVVDSPTALGLLEGWLNQSGAVQVVGTAASGRHALEKICELRPQVVCTEQHMPSMSGLELTRQIMQRCPTPVLVLSESQVRRGGADAFELFAAGALDILLKPSAASLEATIPSLVSSIRVLAGVKVFERRGPIPGTPPKLTPAASKSVVSRGRAHPRIVVIGSSTGGPQALNTVLSALGPTFPVPVLCVQHITKGFLAGLVSWLQSQTRMQVQIAQAGEKIARGKVYFAPEGKHLCVANNGVLWEDAGPLQDGHRPSATVLMRSVAESYGASAIGVLLTGMGEDGALGMLDLHQAGATTLGQDEATSVVYGMCGAAVQLGALKVLLPLDAIGSYLWEQVKER